MTFYDYLKNIFMLLIILQLAPPLFHSIVKQYSTFIMPKTKVGVIKMHGMLQHSSWHADQLHTFFKDKSIQAIVLKIESSGTAAGTGQALAQEIQFLKKEYPKPIITLTENICASGAYYIASSTDYIIASGQAVVGSIGSSMPFMFQLKEFLNAHHIDYTLIKAGTYKGMTDPFEELTDQDKLQLQSVVDDSYEQFVADVAHNRKLAVQNNAEWADGKLFTGRQALELHLVDELGASSSAVTYIKNKKLIDHDIQWVHAQEPGGILKQLFGRYHAQDGSLFSCCGLTIASCVKHICSACLA